MANFGGENWKTVKRILRYCRGTTNVALCYGGSEFTIRTRWIQILQKTLIKRSSLLVMCLHLQEEL